jgi:hypothetical protein
MAFRVMEPIRSKMCINDRILNQINMSDYLEFMYHMKEKIIQI